MKKVSMALAVAGLGTAAMMAACNTTPTESKPTKAQECAAGLSTECLVGEWSVKGLASIADGSMHPSFDYSARPGKLIFNDDGTFEYQVPAGTPSSVNCGETTYGTWSVNGASLTMKSTIGNMCIDNKTFKGYVFTSTPSVKVNDTSTTVDLAFGSLYFLYNISDEAADRVGYNEVFSISAQ